VTLPSPSVAVELPRVSPAPGTEVIVNKELWLADGRRFDLGGVASVRVIPQGWLYTGIDSHVRLLTRAHTIVDLRINAGALVTSPDGTRIGFARYDEARAVTDVSMGVLSGNTFTVKGTTALPAGEGAELAGMVGDRVVLKSSVGGKDAFDYWSPDKPFKPTWNTQVLSFAGEYHGDALGTVRGDGDQQCLARLQLDATGFRVAQRTECASDGYGVAPPGLSPDQHWLAIGQEILDVSTLSSSPLRVVNRCPLLANPAWAPARWEDASHLLVLAATGTYVRCGVDGSLVELPFDTKTPNWWGVS